MRSFLDISDNSIEYELDKYKILFYYIADYENTSTFFIQLIYVENGEILNKLYQVSYETYKSEFNYIQSLNEIPIEFEVSDRDQIKFLTLFSQHKAITDNMSVEDFIQLTNIRNIYDLNKLN